MTDRANIARDSPVQTEESAAEPATSETVEAVDKDLDFSGFAAALKRRAQAGRERVEPVLGDAGPVSHSVTLEETPTAISATQALEAEADTRPGDADATAAGPSADESAGPPVVGPVDATTTVPLAVSRGAVEDPLAECLSFLSKLHARPYTPEQLRAGLPLADGKMSLDSLLKAVERIGMVATQDRCRLSAIPRLALPAILLLNDGRACTLVSFSKKGERAEVFESRAGDGTRMVELSTLEPLYAGVAIYVRPKFHFDQRAYTLELPRPRSWFWGGIRQNWWIYAHAVIATATVNLLALASPLFIMTVYDRVVPNNALETLWVLAIGIAAVAAFDFILRTLRGYLIDVAGKRLDVMLGNRIFEHVLNMQMEARPRSAGSLASTLREFDTLREFLGSATVTAFGDIPFILLFIMVIYLIGGPVAYVPAAAVPIVLIVGILIQVPLNSVIQQSMRQTTQKNALLFEVLNGIETIKGIRAEGWAQRQWEHYVALTAISGMKMKMLTMAATHFTIVSTLLTTVGIVVVGVYETTAGAMTAGALVACVLLNARVMGPLAQVAGLLVRYDQTKLAFNALHQLMKAPVERPPQKKLMHRPYLAGAIEFKDVTFIYPGEDITALNKLSFTIGAGERVAMLGRIGSGKSTTLKLIQNLYNPTEGFVRIDDLDVRHIELSDVRRQIGYVPQETVLFHGSIRENLTQGAPHASDDEIMRALALSGLNDLIKQSPRGLDHEVGERGAQLSGGQRQMIALTRALVLAPPILLLDEPTSNMDNFAERQFLQRMLKWLEGRTLVLVTHRASLLALVNRIILLDRGRIIADGPKDEVMALLAAGKLRAGGS